MYEINQYKTQAATQTLGQKIERANNEERGGRKRSKRVRKGKRYQMRDKEEKREETRKERGRRVGKREKKEIIGGEGERGNGERDR